MPVAEPFGYYKDEDGDLQPIESQLDALKQAEFYIYQGCSMAKVRDWLVNKTGREITTPGLLKSIKYDRRKRKANSGQTSDKSS